MRKEKTTQSVKYPNCVFAFNADYMYITWVLYHEMQFFIYFESETIQL